MNTPLPGLRSPAALVGNLVYFGRMLDKMRLHLAGKLPEDYVANLGRGSDERCVRFLRISYQNLLDRVTERPEATDDELLEWALRTGRHPDDDDIEVWNEFMRKLGWKDQVTARLNERKAAGGFADRADIETTFQFIDADEGRL